MSEMVYLAVFHNSCIYLSVVYTNLLGIELHNDQKQSPNNIWRSYNSIWHSFEIFSFVENTFVVVLLADEYYLLVVRVWLWLVHSHVSLSYLNPGTNEIFRKREIVINVETHTERTRHISLVVDSSWCALRLWLLLLLFVTNDCVCLNRSCIITH